MIDTFSVVSNGILGKEIPNYKTVIVDPLGYYTVYVKEHIEPDPPFVEPPFAPSQGGGGVLIDIEKLRQKYRKKISIKVDFGDGQSFYDQVYTDNIRLSVSDVTIKDDKIYLTLTSISETEEPEQKPEVKIINLKL